jgi:hypothetical protein
MIMKLSSAFEIPITSKLLENKSTFTQIAENIQKTLNYSNFSTRRAGIYSFELKTNCVFEITGLVSVQNHVFN